MPDSIPVPKLRQLKPTLCWAACIEMIAKSFAHVNSGTTPEPFQKEILQRFFSRTTIISKNDQDLLDEFCTKESEGYPALAKSNNYTYTDTFRELFRIECRHTRRKGLPPFEVLKEKIDSSGPVILIAKTPEVEINRHAVVVIGYRILDGVSLIKVHDPSNPGKKNGGYCNPEGGILSYMSYPALNSENFSVGPTEIKYADVDLVHTFSQASLGSVQAIRGKEKVGADNFENIDAIVNRVKEWIVVKCIFGNIESVNSNPLGRIGVEVANAAAFVNSASAGRLAQVIVPVLVEGEIKYEIVALPMSRENYQSLRFGEVRDAKFTGLRDITQVIIRNKTGVEVEVRSVNHEMPDFNLLLLQPFNLVLMVFSKTIEGENVYTYVSPYKIAELNIAPGESFSYQKLADILNSTNSFVK